jgi:hypothetical protein
VLLVQKEEKDKMDVSSLNSGTVDTKNWLNPVVGALKAKSVGAASFQVTDEVSQDTVQLSGGIYRRASGASPTYSIIPITPPFGAGMVDIASSNTNEGGIPISALVPGCSYELYFSARYTDLSPSTGGAIYTYPCFKETQPTDYPDAFCEIIIDSANTSDVQGCEVRVVFRVVSTTDTTITLEATWTTLCNKATIPSISRENTNVLLQTSNTPSRAASTTGRLPFTVWTYAVNGPFAFTRTQLYLRRIS